MSLFDLPFLFSGMISFKNQWYCSKFQIGIHFQWKRSYFLNIYSLSVLATPIPSIRKWPYSCHCQKKSPLALAAQKSTLPDFPHFSKTLAFWLLWNWIDLILILILITFWIKIELFLHFHIKFFGCEIGSKFVPTGRGADHLSSLHSL